MVRERWLLAPDDWMGEGGEVALDPSESRHAISVLRCRPGDEIRILDGRGRCGEGVIAQVRKGRVVADLKTVEATPRVTTGVTVALGILHSQAMDWAIQKCVEIGVDGFVPVVTQRSQGGADHASRRLGHWVDVGRQALKQCRRLWAMDLAAPTTFDEVVDVAPGLYGDPSGPPLSAAPSPGRVTFFVGPEGGFTDEEAAKLDAGSWRAAALGPHVLRAETAAIVGGGILVSSRWYTPSP